MLIVDLYGCFVIVNEVVEIINFLICFGLKDLWLKYLDVIIIYVDFYMIFKDFIVNGIFYGVCNMFM